MEPKYIRQWSASLITHRENDKVRVAALATDDSGDEHLELYRFLTMSAIPDSTYTFLQDHQTPESGVLLDQYLRDVEPWFREPWLPADKGYAYPVDWTWRRYALKVARNWTCEDCSVVRTNKETHLHAHHGIWVSDGGPHDFEFLQCLCCICHYERHPDHMKICVQCLAERATLRQESSCVTSTDDLG